MSDVRTDLGPDGLRSRREAALAAAGSSLCELFAEDRVHRLLAADGGLPAREGYLDSMRDAVARGGFAELRREKRRRLLEIAARDLNAEIQMEEAAASLSFLADACIEITLEAIGGAGDLAVIAMGKLGGLELNYVSDIDLMFVARDSVDSAVAAAGALLHELGEVTPEGRAYEIDLNLRPEGRSGSLVRSLDGYLEYYRRWSKPWEHQALIKARACAGDAELADGLIAGTRDIVYPREVTEERVASIRKMKERVEEHAARPHRRGAGSEADVKLGPGGIRDIEFSVQLLQLVHGGSDPSVRSTSTLEALTSLVDGGYVADEDGAGLGVAYRWLRNVEHRLQLRRERRVHHLPAAEEERRDVARVMGFRDTPVESAVARFDRAHRAVLTDVRARFDKLFYRPMIEALSESAGGGLSAEALRDRLRVLGYRDAERASRHLTDLVSGTTRHAKLFRVLTPALLRFLAPTSLPDDGLFAFVRLSEALEGRIDTLGALRDNPPAIAFLARVLGSGRTLGEVLAHVPEELQTIADPSGPGRPKDRDRLVREAIASLGWRDPDDRLDGLRRFKRREMLRVALSDLSGAADIEAVGAGLADLADACLEAAMEEVDIPFAVIAMGKLGGRELHYSSDIDVMFVHDGDRAAGEAAAEQLMRAIGEITPEGQAFRIDPTLRPEGRSGPLVRSLDSYLEYYERWARPWEHQALIKARAAAGDTSLGERVVAETRGFAFPDRLDPTALAEIRHLKARMERERIPRGSNPRRHMKMGPGGAADVEFSVQVLQAMHGHRHISLRTSNTRAALEAAVAAAVIAGEDARRLREAYDFLSLLRNRSFFMAGKPVDSLPARPEDLEALAIAAGFTDQPRQELEEHYMRVTRRARAVAKRIIYGG